MESDSKSEPQLHRFGRIQKSLGELKDLLGKASSLRACLLAGNLGVPTELCCCWSSAYCCEFAYSNSAGARAFLQNRNKGSRIICYKVEVSCYLFHWLPGGRLLMAAMPIESIKHQYDGAHCVIKRQNSPKSKVLCLCQSIN